MIRSFVGIPLAGPEASALAAAQAGLPAGRPVDPEGFHLTLAFLGNQPAPVLEDLHLELETIAAPAVALVLEGLGVFGSMDRPRSLHAAVRPDPALKALRGRVCTAARTAGISMPRERFVPHVTLARFPGRPLEPEDRLRLEAYVERRAGLRVGPVAVTVFSLFRSHLTSEGPIYEVLADYPLG